MHEECGVVGIFDAFDEFANSEESLDLASLTYYGLFALQHRGQESCGIAINDDGNINCYKDMGLVGDVFKPDKLASLKGNISIGHVRYSTTGASTRENAQPLVTHYIKGTLSIAHNGNLTNTNTLRTKLEQEGAIFQTTVDSEIIAYMIAKSRSQCDSVENAVIDVMTKIEGGYALLVMSPRKLIAARDPYGLKPLVMGKIGHAIVFASETCALDAMGAELIRDVKPGEVVIVDRYGIRYVQTPARKCAKCVFEYIYFARPDSVMDGISVFESRLEAGRLLARQHPVEADIVIGIPESGLDAALGYSMESGIPYVKGFVKNNYIGRTFIKPSQALRKQAVRIKLNPIDSAVKGKRVIMIDDSIVRGTTIANIVKMLRTAGATEVHVRISSPPFLYPCFYGTDVPSRSNLIACQHTIPEISDIIGADSLGYLDVNTLGDMLHEEGHKFCDACFTGDYPNIETGIDLLKEDAESLEK
ncbi:MAG: amidophosphoribosyltransferase [Saccharofermentans sp.]|nr:amidophosphoribosyltransferase [Saccharofermentans sp.]